MHGLTTPAGPLAVTAATGNKFLRHVVESWTWWTGPPLEFDLDIEAEAFTGEILISVACYCGINRWPARRPDAWLSTEKLASPIDGAAVAERVRSLVDKFVAEMEKILRYKQAGRDAWSAGMRRLGA